MAYYLKIYISLQLILFSNTLCCQNTIILLNGTSSAGKSTIRKELSAILGSNWEPLSLDDYVIDQYLQNLSKENSVYKTDIDAFLTLDFGKIIGSDESTQRLIQKIYDCFDRKKNVILDVVLNDKKTDFLIKQLHNCNICFVLIYCNISNLKHRVAHRNNIANKFDATTEEKLNKRDLARAIRRFSQLYQCCSCNDCDKVDTISRTTFDGILLDVYTDYEHAAIPSDDKKPFDEFAKDALFGLGFDLEAPAVNIKPRLFYDIIVDTNKNNPHECAHQIANNIRFVSLEKNRNYLATAEITEINSINLALDALEKADTDTLVVFDVGEMLYILQNNLYRLIRNPHIFDNDDVMYMKNLMNEFEKTEPNWKEIIKSNIMLNCSPELVEKSIVSVIKKLQSNNIKTIALCSANPGRYGVIKSTKDWRFSALQNLGIDFSTSFKQQNIVFDNLNRYHDDYPEYYKGILFGSSHLPTGHNPKGLTLCAFFDAINWTPKNVIIFDDCKDYLINIAEELKKKNISYHCFWYNLTSKQSPKLNRDVVNLQIEYIKKGIFLSDQETAELLISNSEHYTTLGQKLGI